MSSRTRSEIACAITIAIALLGASGVARADDDPETVARRERFRAGMEKYAAGRYADAIVVWEAIYREIGERAGYKLAFNLGRAYDAFGDSTRAAEHYEIFVRQVEERRTANEVVETEIDRWENDAKARLGELAATRGRIRVVATDRPTAVRIDAGEPRLAGFVAYVTPGPHVVTFGSGKDEQRRAIEVEQGAIVELAPPVPPPEAPRPEPAPASTPAAPRWETRTERPFSPVVIYVAGAAAAASVVVPVLTYSTASAIRDDYEAANDRRDAHAGSIAPEYDSARSAAYASLAIPVVLGAATAGLAAWWLFGAKETRVVVGAGSISGRF